jgi:hypothetical protein
METHNQKNSDLSVFEASLSRLAPAEALNRDALMFRAGQAAGAAARRRWQMLAAAVMCLAGGLAASVAALGMSHPRTQVVERVVYVQHDSLPPAPARPVAAPAREPEQPLMGRGEESEFSYLRIRRQVLEHGLSALPVSSGGWGGAQDARQLMDELLRDGDADARKPI